MAEVRIKRLFRNSPTKFKAVLFYAIGMFSGSWRMNKGDGMLSIDPVATRSSQLLISSPAQAYKTNFLLLTAMKQRK